MDDQMKVKFWGTRGLISSPSKSTEIYGGNTSCIQLMHKDSLILVDSGYGATNLGEHLMDIIIREKKSFDIHIFISQFHWDHIQGLPFFQPIYFKSSNLHLYSPLSTDDLYHGLNVLFNESYSPFEALNKMPANVALYQIEPGLMVDELEVSYVHLDHGDDDTPAFGYRFESPTGQSVVVATDHHGKDKKKNKALTKLAQDAGLLILGGLFTEEEYQKHKNWGFASMESSLKQAQEAKARSILLTHHHPLRKDSELVAIKKRILKMPSFSGLNFDFAREQIEYDVEVD